VTEPQIEIIECLPDLGGRALVELLARPRTATYVLVRATGVEVPDSCLAALVQACGGAMAASASPLPSGNAPTTRVRSVPVHDALPPEPSLALPCAEVCVFLSAALESVVLPDRPGTEWREALASVGRRLVDAGWRHVGAPGAALDWTHTPLAARSETAAWTSSTINELEGPANEGLSTHVRWVDLQLREVRVVIDGACLTDDPHNGTQALVVEIARWLKRTRRHAEISLAVRSRFVQHLRRLMEADDVAVVDRADAPTGFDVVYRPYQMLDPADLSWPTQAAHRLVIGQLDMIGFCNPSYHPSPALFHAVRNLQRRALRMADGVTFISEFGRAAALAECPDMERERTYVVSCGAGASSQQGGRSPASVDLNDGFLLCLSATFWHKNRTHAVRVFRDLCERHAYPGALVIAGPEPLYGRSTSAEDRLIDSMPIDIARRVNRVGQIDEAGKWWLLRHAHLVLYPSIVEGFGMVPFEAASVGTPCLAFDGSGLSEVVGRSPALLGSWQAAEWADAAQRLVASPEARTELVESIDRAARVHGWGEVAERTWQAFDATLARPHRARSVEEGGYRSRVAPRANATATTARAVHFTNRVVAYARRRIAGPGSG
jgi:glycosyltransferase involved in cell wall biosynthesis